MNDRYLYQLINALCSAMEVKDFYTYTHQKNVSNISRLIAQELELPKAQIEAIRLSAMLHDIGKIGIPTDLLTKAGILRKEEFELIKLHSVISEEILKGVDFKYPISTIIRQHHERLDGSGYPDGLLGNEILLEAKIIAVADVVESMSSSRAYRKALGLTEAIKEINEQRGILYDSKVVDACNNIYQKNLLNQSHSEGLWGSFRNDLQVIE